MSAKEIVVRYFKVDSTDIVFLKAVLESYEGMVVMRTVEVGKPIIELLIAHDFASTIETVLQDLRKQISFEEVARPENAPAWP